MLQKLYQREHTSRFRDDLGNIQRRDMRETAQQLLRYQRITRRTIGWTVVLINLNSPGVCLQTVEKMGNVRAVLSVECVWRAGMSDSRGSKRYRAQPCPDGVVSKAGRWKIAALVLVRTEFSKITISESVIH